MWLDAFLAYLHYAAIFMLVGFMAAELVLIRGVLDARHVRQLGKVDVAIFISAIAALVTGGARLAWGAKGMDFYIHAWPFYVKVGLFVLIALVSVKPTRTFIRWNRAFDNDPAWNVPEAERLAMRRVILLQVHLAAMIPVFAVVMSRGLGR